MDFMGERVKDKISLEVVVATIEKNWMVPLG